MPDPATATAFTERHAQLLISNLCFLARGKIDLALYHSRRVDPSFPPAGSPDEPQSVATTDGPRQTAIVFHARDGRRFQFKLALEIIEDDTP